MNTPTNHDDLKKSFENLFAPRPEEVETKHDAFMLMAAFLSEIEYIQEQDKISRKELAKKVKTSGSYLTQVFRNKKPLNFLTLAKIKRALDIRFEIKAFRKNSTNPVVTPNEYNAISLSSLAFDSLQQTGDTIPSEGSSFNIPQEFLLINAINDTSNSSSTQTIKKAAAIDPIS
jgi:transcriptional regulator with XRE-family HTH domain